MSDTPFFGSGDFLRGMLGDLVRMMPAGPGLQWQLAYQLAAQISSGGGPDANPDPIERIRFEDLSAIAELHVAEVTGMPISPAGASVRLVPASRSDWARRTLDIWRPVLDKLAAALSPTDAGGETGLHESAPGSAGGRLEATDRFADSGLSTPAAGSSEDEMAALLGQWATAMFPAMTAWQIGSVAGHLAERALGAYDVPLAPSPGSELLVVSANLAAVAADWSLPIDDLRLWLCVHEMAYHTALSRPAVSDRIANLVIEHAEQVRPDADMLGHLLEEADISDLSSFAQLLGDPSTMSPAPANASLRRVRADLDAVTAAVSGYAEYVTSTIANRLIGNTTPIGEAMRRRRVSRGDGEKVAESLFGLRLDQSQIDRGARFVAGVLDRSGEVQLAKMWTEAATLPTPAEIDAPGLWLARLDLPADA